MRSLLIVILLAACTVASAEEAKRSKPSNLQSLPEAPPPPVISADPSLEPEVTITQKDGAKVEEYRIHGKLFAMKVTPAKGPAYFLVDERGDGRFVRHDNL